MNQQTTMPADRRPWWALSGVLFAAFFLGGDIVRGILTSVQLPLPGAPAAEVAGYYNNSQMAILAVAGFQILSSIALFIFVACVVGFIRQAQGSGSALPDLSRGGGLLAAILLLVCALLSVALIPIAAGDNLTLVEVLRYLNFLTGGTLHVATLGVFIGAASIVARNAKALPAWIYWLGIVTAALAILSLFSLVFFYASLFILLGRLLAFVWCITVGIVLVLRKQRAATVRGDHLVRT